MFDLDTLGYLNEKAVQSYRDSNKTVIGRIQHLLGRALPPSLSMLTSYFRDAAVYKEFVELVEKFLPERRREILSKPTPGAQVAQFASNFEDRYFHLHPSSQDEMMDEPYSQLLQNIPIDVMGFSYEDYDSVASGDFRDGLLLMTYLFEPPRGNYQSGERVAMADRIPDRYKDSLQKFPEGGISLDEAKSILKGKRWHSLLLWGQYINQSTDNQFLNTDYEMLYNGGSDLPWTEENVECCKENWLAAEDIWGQMTSFADWLEDTEKGPENFEKTVAFIVEKLPKRKVKVSIESEFGCSLGSRYSMEPTRR